MAPAWPALMPCGLIIWTIWVCRLGGSFMCCITLPWSVRTLCFVSRSDYANGQDFEPHRRIPQPAAGKRERRDRGSRSSTETARVRHPAQLWHALPPDPSSRPRGELLTWSGRHNGPHLVLGLSWRQNSSGKMKSYLKSVLNYDWTPSVTPFSGTNHNASESHSVRYTVLSHQHILGHVTDHGSSIF